MSRRRYISTDISLDKDVNRLATKYGDFAVLLYTWMIPHAGDDALIKADPEELLFMVVPGRRDKNEDNIIEALNGMHDLELIFWDKGNNFIYFPTSSFYKYQTYIKQINRRTKEISTENSDIKYVEINSAENTVKNNSSAGTAENTVSLPHSLSLPHSSSSSSSEREASLFKAFEENFVVELNELQKDKIYSYLDDGLEPELIEKAISITRENGKNINYFWGVLNRFIEQGTKTLKAYELQENERKKQSDIKTRGQPIKKEKVPDYILHQEERHQYNKNSESKTDIEKMDKINRLLKNLGEKHDWFWTDRT